MWFENTSRYSDAETLALVEFAMAEIDHVRLAVRVKNSNRAYRGRAYEGVPSLSPLSRVEGIDRLVTIGIGTEADFPCTNQVVSVRWRLVRAEEDVAGLSSHEVRVRRGPRRSPRRLERRELRTHGYGGLGSPLLEFHDWREALVAVAAHEARHVWQYQHDARRSEVDAERYAGERLRAFRAIARA